MGTIARTAIVLTSFTVFFSCRTPYGATDKTWDESVKEVITTWPARTKKAAEWLIYKYGQPVEMTSDILVWKNNGPWQVTVLYRDEIPHNFPVPHSDFLQQTINYKVDPEKFDDLVRYNGSLIPERTRGTLSARCDKEELNILSLNLAHEVLTGKKTVEQARDDYARLALKFSHGKSDPYLEKLQFLSPKELEGDKDSATVLH